MSSSQTLMTDLSLAFIIRNNFSIAQVCYVCAHYYLGLGIMLLSKNLNLRQYLLSVFGIVWFFFLV